MLRIVLILVVLTGNFLVDQAHAQSAKPNHFLESLCRTALNESLQGELFSQRSIDPSNRIPQDFSLTAPGTFVVLESSLNPSETEVSFQFQTVLLQRNGAIDQVQESRSVTLNGQMVIGFDEWSGFVISVSLEDLEDLPLGMKIDVAAALHAKEKELSDRLYDILMHPKLKLHVAQEGGSNE